MAIPRRISFLEESRNDKFSFLGDRGIWNLFLGVLVEFWGMSFPKNSKNSTQNSKQIWKKKWKKKISSKFGMFSNNTKNWLVILKNPEKSEICWQFSDFFIFFIKVSTQNVNSVYSRSSANFVEDSRCRGVVKSIPRGIEEWKKVRDIEDRGTRNSSCHPYRIRYY